MATTRAQTNAGLRPKAQRLLNEGRVRQVANPVAEFTVQGDHGTYTVFIGANAQTCTCPHHGRCTHIEAAVEQVLRSSSAHSQPRDA